jgi:hypothetical protein
MAEVTFRGVTYSSLAEIAKSFGVTPHKVYRRFRSGWSIEQCLDLKDQPKREAPNANALKTRLGNFHSVRDAAIKLGLEEGTIASRLRKGWTPDQAVGASPLPQKIRGGIQTLCEGVLFQSVAAFARHYGKNQIRVRKRLEMGWTPEQAVDLVDAPPRFRDEVGSARDHAWTQKMVTPDGAILPATKLGSYNLYVVKNNDNGKEYIGITTNSIKARFRGHWRMVQVGRHSKLYNAMRKAAEDGKRDTFSISLVMNDARDFRELQEQEVEEIRVRNTIANGYNTSEGGSIGTSKSVEIDGEVFPSRQAAANFYGIDPAVFNIRMGRLGWSPEEAVGITKRDKYQNHEFEIEGKKFTSLKQAAEHFGVKYQLAHDRYNAKGWTIEQSLNLTNLPDSSRKAGIEVEVDGLKFKSVKKAADHFGVKGPSVNNRMRKHGETAQEALSILLKKGRRTKNALDEKE